ncbi:MAG: hypothetical protein K8R35_10515 [Bacteroidales bacterium]|nr:hypothetical protein [Bacteroidales bacterium]
MKTIRVSSLNKWVDYPDLAEVSARLDDLSDVYLIDIINWERYSYRPDVKFKIAYSEKEIFIKYYISEDYVKAEKTELNQRVCEDSCVEFFVSPANDGIYYNFEFNSIGTCLLGSGTSREDSRPAEKEIVERVRRLSSLDSSPFGEERGVKEWTLTVAIPVDLFFRHKIEKLKGQVFRVNFYKCGDNLSVPHYLTWNEVGTREPDYHQPEYFGELIFV